MKLSFVPMLLAGSLLPSLSNANDLDEIWYLDENPGFDYASRVFSLTYKFSEKITGLAGGGFSTATLYLNQNDDLNCKTDLTGAAANSNAYDLDATTAALSLTSEAIVANSDASATFKEKQQQTIKVTIDPDKLSGDASIWSEDTAAGTNTIQFCVRFGLRTEEADNDNNNGDEVNFLESRVSLTVTLKGEFTVDSISVEPKDKLIRTANQEYKLDAYQCSGKDATKNGIRDGVPALYKQGDVIKVCVEPNKDAQNDNIFMKSVEEFIYTSIITRTQAAGPTQNAIINNAPQFGLTEMDPCTGHTTCMIETILFATFYQEPGTVTGNGKATMQFGEGARRMLRNLQEAQDDVSSDFDVSFGLSAEDSFNDSQFSGATSSMSILALVGSAAAALLL